jgi:RimJ/RimL family protein N-acetyltransferase
MNVLTFRPEHVAFITPQTHQRVSLKAIEYLSRLGELGPAISGEVDGRIIACGGIIRQEFNTGTAWAFFDEGAGRHFIKLDRVMRRMLELVAMRRIEATVETDFTPGCRWLDLLGFHSEGVMRSYGPNGEDHWRYARVF